MHGGGTTFPKLLDRDPNLVLDFFGTKFDVLVSGGTVIGS